MADSEILKGLNKEQEQAVTQQDGPLLIIAGAGTGKTTVVTRRIAHLIENKLASSDEILALTFTDKAAGEMEERVQALLPIGYFDMWISTFHAFGDRVLKDHALEIGLSNNYKLLSDTEQWLLVREHIDEFELDYYRPKGNPVKFVQALIAHFSRLKDEDITPAEYIKYAQQLQLDTDSEFQKKKKGLTDAEKAQIDEAQRVHEVAHAYKKYQDLLRENNAFDFGDLITETIHLFKERPAILEQYRKQFKYILVDEFQDTNYAQYELVKMLAEPKNNLTVVADDDQSIYSFRGAAMSNILIFKDDYPKAKEISLIENYRSAQNILDLSYSFIQSNNPNRLEQTLKINKRLHSNIKTKAEIQHLHAKSLEGEAKLVLDKIIEISEKKKEFSWNDIAILVRANDQAKTFIPYLERAGIPYQFLASQGLFAKPVILDIIAFLKLLDNYHESRAMFRVLSFGIWKISQDDIIRIVQSSHKKTQSIYETCSEIRSVTKLNKATYQTIESILSLIQRLTEHARHKSAGEVILAFLEESGYIQYIAEQDTRGAAEQILYINQFYKYVEAFERAHSDTSTYEFIKELSLIIDAGDEGKLQPDFDDGPEAVKIMTIHAAKGLEFDHVFIVNLVDKRFPSVHRKEAIAVPDELVKDVLPEGDWHLQEERRLFYVAMTRAKKGLYLTSGEDYGGTRKKKPSRFLIEAGYEDTKPQPTGEVLFTDKKVTREIDVIDETKYLPSTFSFTQLKAYESCPWQYRFSFLLKVPSAGNPSFSFGKTMHNTLYEFFRRLMQSTENEQGGLFDKPGNSSAAQAPTLEELLKIYQEKWIDEWYYSKKQKEEYYKKGKQSLKKFYQLHEKQWPQVMMLEQGFNLQVGDYILKGAIDRADLTKKGIEIVDYKTGNFPKTGKKDAEQLYIYALALQQIVEQNVSQLTYYYLEENKPLSIEIEDKKMEQVTVWIKDIIDQIQSGNYQATPGFHCKYCDYRDICEFRK